jgi:uncharacterized protein YbcC (UPF0753/DUF2309 family)
MTALLSPAVIEAASDRAVRQIPPLWPLASSVAVNPFLGQAGESLAATGARLGRVAGAPVTMPRAWYRAKVAAGQITGADLAAALAAAPGHARPTSIAALKDAVKLDGSAPIALPTMADLVAEVTSVAWPEIVADRIGAWAAGHFDEGQALWAAPRGRSAYAAWRAFATHDLTPEIAGLAGFARHVADAPQDATAAIARAVHRLGLTEAALDLFLHRMLMTLGGWSQLARYHLWQAELAGRTDSTLADLLAIRLVWEEALYANHAGAIGARWEAVLARYAAPLEAPPALIIDSILQEAAERAAQRDLAAILAAPGKAAGSGRPVLQAAFCIDVRSELLRRALESLDPGIRTLGFAGFFGLGTAHRGFASDVEELRLPVLLNPAVRSCSGGASHKTADRDARYRARAIRAWGRFKQAAVSSFAFVEATGPVHFGKLVSDSFHWRAAARTVEPAPQFDPALDLDTRAGAAEKILRAMSLTSGFAPLVILAGHGASVDNNPHASGLQCGACGGYSGEVNARLLAGLLNDPATRVRLTERGIAIPADTVFVAALHDTTTDEVALYDAEHLPASHSAAMKQAQAWLKAAGALARGERAPRLPRARSGGAVLKRSRDWSEIRPEWALAGCKAFIAAPRHRTAGRRLEGRAFLHDYDWRQDDGFAVLELILTAPVVVASWISLQYYGSTVAPAVFGGGNKLLHNVTGGVGVVEGNGGLLRAGLPWQSVHDGSRYIHEPLRLTVCVEAPVEAITAILERHEGVRTLFDQRWLHLVALDENGQMAWRYAGDLRWEAEGALPVAKAA